MAFRTEIHRNRGDARSWTSSTTQLHCRDLLFGEEGAAYTMSVAIVIPFYVLMIATIIELSLVMVVKLGTLNAAYAAARAASVWQPAEIDPQLRERMVHLAASQALAPFASSKELHLEPTGRLSEVGNDEDDAFREAFLRFSDGFADGAYMPRKRQYALAATEVEMEFIKPDVPSEAAVKVTVTYQKPIDLPVIGHLLGRRASWPNSYFFTLPVVSTAAMQLEIPKSTSRTLGIRYDSWEY